MMLQAQEVGALVELSVKFTVSGFAPVVGVPVKAATGTETLVTVT